MEAHGGLHGLMELHGGSWSSMELRGGLHGVPDNVGRRPLAPLRGTRTGSQSRVRESPHPSQVHTKPGEEGQY